MVLAFLNLALILKSMHAINNFIDLNADV